MNAKTKHRPIIIRGMGPMCRVEGCGLDASAHADSTGTKPAIGTRVRLTVDPLTVPTIANALAGFGPIPPHDLRRPTYVVKDTMDRKTYNQPDRIGIGPADLGIAFGVTLDQVELA